jgi:hypothetical protein
VERAAYQVPTEPGFSIEMKPTTLKRYLHSSGQATAA